ncbi:restriction endonuclease subunit M [Vibrio cholerae]|nr:restriction endonuclease subunit M [Vibrio cholerae]EHK6026190.1 restriction endonuclease subunit M [Vibrio parahaemolyticus]
MSQVHSEIRKAVQVIEAARYRMGVAEFVYTFIDHWAYQQTGLYPPSSKMPKELEPTAIELSHILSAAMRNYPGIDVLGMFFSECGYYKQGQNFFPTPPELGRLLAALVGWPSNHHNQELSFYEPCSGTGAIAMKWIMEKIHNGGKETLEQSVLVLEDVDRTMCKAALIQIINLLSNLEVKVRKLSINAVDVLSRAPKGLVYILEPQPLTYLDKAG